MSEHLSDAALTGFASSAGREREEARRHLLGCAACRSRLAWRDPSRVFSLLGQAPVPRSLLDELSRNVAEAIDGGRSRTPLWRSLGAAAASLLLAGLVGLTLLNGPAGPSVETTLPELAAAAPRAAVDLLEPTEDAQVFDLSVGDTQVVMIFDEGLEL